MPRGIHVPVVITISFVITAFTPLTIILISILGIVETTFASGLNLFFMNKNESTPSEIAIAEIVTTLMGIAFFFIPSVVFLVLIWSPLIVIFLGEFVDVNGILASKKQKTDERVGSFSITLKNAKELDKKAQKEFENGNFTSARSTWKECLEYYKKALESKSRSSELNKSINYPKQLQESINVVLQNILNSHVNEADAIDKLAARDYAKKQFNAAKQKWSNAKTCLNDAIKFKKEHSNLTIDTNAVKTKHSELDQQLIRVEIVLMASI